MPNIKDKKNTSKWSSPIPEERWKGFRRELRGINAFQSLTQFEKAQVAELDECLDDHEKETLGRLLKRGKKSEIEIFIRTHGANPIFPPESPLAFDVGVAKADMVKLEDPTSAEAAQAILNGDVVHVLFQAGEGSRFKQGPFYNINPMKAADVFKDEVDLGDWISKINEAKGQCENAVSEFILNESFGPKQVVFIRAAVRRVVADEIKAGRINPNSAGEIYQQAIQNQKILFLISQREEVTQAHNENLKKFKFFGFNPAHLVTINQQLVHGISADEKGKVSLFNDPAAQDAAGHLYVLLQAARPEDFTTYTDSGRPLKSAEVDGLAYLAQKGGKYLSVIRINDMDRHSTEIINGKAVSYALQKFSEGFVNVIEGVANLKGQKGGTGTTFVDPETHVLTETHENSFPTLSRPFEDAMKKYLEQNNGRHPAYNAMRQIADLSATRRVLREYGARIVFVPRQKEIKGETVFYLGVDMPMGDLSLLLGEYKSRMFQFVSADQKELLIHDMKTKENLHLAMAAVENQLKDPHIIAAVQETISQNTLPFESNNLPQTLYGAPAPEFN